MADELDRALDALERLMHIFQVERILYLIVTCIGFVLTVYAAIRLLTEQAISVPGMTAVLSGSGLVTAASLRVTFFLNKSFQIIEDVIRKITGVQAHGNN
jgi:hypothetical protein